jgi:4-hydroxybenzoate polyprenyltransferase
VAAHLELFDDVFGSDDLTNLTGEKKADALRERFDAFDYVGDSEVDFAVWRAAQNAILSASSPAHEKEFSLRQTFAHTFPMPAKSKLRLWLKALRLHQWVKNVLMFAPLALAHQFSDGEKLMTLAIGFMAFNICASSVYVLNDLLDLAADRQHPRKRARPFASVDLPLEHGLAVWPVLVVAGFSLALYAGAAFALVLAGYYVLTLAYSFDLKRRALVDVFALAALYTLRIIAGAVAASVILSPWLLGFSVFIFLSLAIVKRVAELCSVRQRGVRQIAGRGYQIDDLVMLEMLGVAAGYASVVVLALYVSAPESHVLYAHHQLLWLFAPLVLFWISRVWLITHRGEMHDDPIVFAMKDPPSRIVGLLAMLVFEFAALGQ